MIPIKFIVHESESWIGRSGFGKIGEHQEL